MVLIVFLSLTQWSCGCWHQAHHLSPVYDFHGYIRRTMEADFKRVVGIRSLRSLHNYSLQKPSVTYIEKSVELIVMGNIW